MSNDTKFVIDAGDETSDASFVLTAILRKRIRALAIRLGCSQSEIARLALTEFLERKA